MHHPPPVQNYGAVGYVPAGELDENIAYQYSCVECAQDKHHHRLQLGLPGYVSEGEYDRHLCVKEDDGLEDKEVPDHQPVAERVEAQRGLLLLRFQGALGEREGVGVLYGIQR